MMTNLELLFAILNLLAIGIIGFFQIKINYKLTELQGVVAINAEPNGNTIRIVNVGKVNLYIHKFETIGNNHTFEKPRLIALNSWYWIPLPDLSTLKNNGCEFKLYLTDEFNKKYIFIGGIEKQKGGIATIWSHKLEFKRWEI